MTLTKLKTKNQVTIPVAMVKMLHLHVNEFLAVDVQDNYIRLTPVEVEPKYTSQDLEAMDRLIDREKGKAKVFKPGKEFDEYIQKLTK